MEKNTESMKEIPSLIKELIDGHSTQNKLASKLWTTLAIVSIIAIIPYDIKDKIEIPLIKKDVSSQFFYSFSSILISILFISFSNLHIQVIRSRQFLQRAINGMKDKYLIPNVIHIQDVVDCIITSNLNRVAPLAQIFQGNKQFYPEADSRSKQIRKLTYSYYFIVKTLTLLIFYGLPAIGFYISLRNSSLLNIHLKTCLFYNWLFYPFMIIAIISFVTLMITEFKFILSVSIRINK